MGSKIVQWIKSHTMVVICGTLGVLSLTAIVLGYVLPTTQADLDADRQVFNGLQGAVAKPANARVIEEVRRQQADIRRSVQRFLGDAAKTNPHTLLNPNVFPTIKERFDPNVFVEKCDQKRRELLSILKAQDKPTAAEIAEYGQEILLREQKRKREAGDTSGSPAAGLRGMGAVNPAPGNVLMPMGGMMTTTSPESLTPEQRVKSDPAAGAAVKRAHEIYCYADNQALDPRNQITIQGSVLPAVELMWEAQMSMWIQEDIIQALAKLNNDAAQPLPENDRWVGNLPVKHLMYIVVGSYLPKSAGTGSASGGDMGGRMGGSTYTPTVSQVGGSDLGAPHLPAATADAVFTKRGSAEKVDVVHVAVGLVIDANYLLKVIEEIGKTGFYTPLLVNYEVVEADPSYHDYIYGAGPVIRVRMEFEHCLLRDKLMVGDKKLEDVMPEAIKTGTYVSDPARTGGPGGTSPGGISPGGMMPRPGSPNMMDPMPPSGVRLQ